MGGWWVVLLAQSIIVDRHNKDQLFFLTPQHVPMDNMTVILTVFIDVGSFIKDVTFCLKFCIIIIIII